MYINIITSEDINKIIAMVRFEVTIFEIIISLIINPAMGGTPPNEKNCSGKVILIPLFSFATSLNFRTLNSFRLDRRPVRITEYPKKKISHELFRFPSVHIMLTTEDKNKSFHRGKESQDEIRVNPKAVKIKANIIGG